MGLTYKKNQYLHLLEYTQVYTLWWFFLSNVFLHNVKAMQKEKDGINKGMHYVFVSWITVLPFILVFFLFFCFPIFYTHYCATCLTACGKIFMHSKFVCRSADHTFFGSIFDLDVVGGVKFFGDEHEILEFTDSRIKKWLLYDSWTKESWFSRIFLPELCNSSYKLWFFLKFVISSEKRYLYVYILFTSVRNFFELFTSPPSPPDVAVAQYWVTGINHARSCKMIF